MKEPLRDRNGLTEEEFLARYDASRFARPSVTVDVLFFCGERLLLIRRGGHPFLGRLALPGGFVEPGETVEQAAAREMFEETGVRAGALTQLRVFSDPDRDPRTRIITVPFVALGEDAPPAARAGDDAAEAAWYRAEAAVLERARGPEGGEAALVRLRLIGSGGAEYTCLLRRTMPAFPAGGPLRPAPRYTIEGENPLACDHAAMICEALRALGRID